MSLPRVDPKPPVEPPEWWDDSDYEDEEDWQVKYIKGK